MNWIATYVILPGQCLLRGLLLNETGCPRHLPGIHSHSIFVFVLQGSWREVILFYVQLVCHSVEDRSLPVAGSTVSTVGTDPLFRRLQDALSDASGPSKLAESVQNREQSIQMVQTSRELSPQPP